MRKVFASQRLENVEAVAHLLEQDGIEVRIEHPRSFGNAIRGNFSYLDKDKRNPPPPAVWVVRSDDQPRARALMRGAGLLQDTTRNPAPNLNAAARGHGHAKKRASRLRYGLLALVLVIVVVNFIRSPADSPPPSTDTAAATGNQALTLLDQTTSAGRETYVIATPPQLAVMLARRVLDAHPARALCLAIDGRDPAQSTLDALAASGIETHADSACPSTTAPHLNVYGYTTDGSGTGTASLTLRRGAQHAAETVYVRRTGAVWVVLGNGH